jgi:hypothetical protein
MIEPIASRTHHVRLLFLAASVLALLHPAMAAANGAGPALGTPEQIATEKLALQVLADPKLKAAEAELRATLASDPAAATPEGRATLDHALALWTTSLVISESAGDTDRPVIVWNTDDTPHSWLGYTFPGMGIAGDNPDNIYRAAFLDGAHRYEVRGHIPANGPVQFSFELVRGTPGKVVLTTIGKGHVDMGNQLGMLTDRTVTADANGDFVVTIDPDPANGRPNHLQSQPGPLEVVLRNSLSDWSQVPTSLSVRRVDGGPSGPPLTEAEDATRAAADLPGWVASWAGFKESWMGPPPSNTVTRPVPRDGGWGFAAASRYDLKDDEALVVTTTNGGARYTGLQALDRWFMAPDSRKAFTSRNIGQVTPNADGSVTYVVSVADPGVSNWISTAGFHQGFLNFRWQQTPSGVDAATLVRGYKLVKLSDLKSALPPETRWVTPAERAAALRQRAIDYERRLAE